MAWGTDEMRVRTKIPNSAIISYVGAAIGAKLQVRGAVETVDVVRDERLVPSGVTGKVLDLQSESRIGLRIEVYQPTSWPMTGAGSVAFSGENPKSPSRLYSVAPG
ncbi:MAG: hypothetical protein C5B58_08470 [Acidobacteria bacterium]|nr:MAG: hypothetical protein C5B58_08470 [Acidobacteriota bacterium]